LDETCVKVNGLEYWVYAALDVDRNEIYEGLSSKYSYHQQFIDEVLNYCIGDQNSSLIMFMA
jgi:transposase-like protein